MGELFKSKKAKLTLIASFISILVLIIQNYFPDIPEATITSVLWTIAGLFGVSIAGQAAADVASKGATSSSGAAIMALEQNRLDTGKMVADALNLATKGQPGNAVSGSAQTATTPAQPSAPPAGTSNPVSG